MSEFTLYSYHVTSFKELSGQVFQILAAPREQFLEYKAGQYVKILYPDGQFFPFSIANTPRSTGELEFHIRSTAQDPNTKKFLKELLRTKSLNMTGPYGHCYFHEDQNHHLVFATVGTGFAPAKAMIEFLLQQNFKRMIHLYWGVRFEDDFYLSKLPLQWQRNYQNFKYTPVVSKADSNWTGKQGRIPEIISEDYQNLFDYQVFIFGPKVMAECAQKIFSEHGLLSENLFSDML